VLTGRDLDAVARDADRVWSSATGERGGPEIAPPGDPGSVAGARKAPLPRRAAPQLATLVTAPPEGDDWLHEIKLDGYRLLCRLERGKARLVSRNGHDWTDRFPALAEAVAALPTDAALLDGEAVVFDARGRSDFQALQGSLGRDRPDLHLTLFDCLCLGGFDLRDAPLVERKRALRHLVAGAPARSRVRYSDHVVGRGAEFFEAACRSGVEGIVSKRVDAPYRSGRTRAWLKVKCSKRQEFAIVGFTEPGGTRQGLGALLLGAHDADGALRYCGKVGTGFDAATLAALRAKLARLERARPPVVDPPSERGVHWVTPRLVAEVAFTEWTRDGKVRHPVFLGLREDKSAAEVRIEAPEAAAPEPEAAPRPTRSEIAGVRLSSPDRVYFPDVGITKSELAEYYEAMAERVLPGLAQRPLTLLRCPEGIDGECFYQKRANESVPDVVPRVRVRKDREAYAMVGDLRSLIALVQIGVLELHPWAARADRLDRPDLVIFDLDPDPAVPWPRVVETARALRAFLADLGLVPFARLTGGKGVHVVAPLVRRSSWDEVKAFSAGVAGELVRLAPGQLTANMAKARRPGKIFIDVFRNAPEATAIASWSVRARPGAPVALPLAWDELEALGAPLHESPREALARLERPDPWREFEASRRPLSREALRRVGSSA
jgi:bifunctional non-homologous end joining protein LigD